MLTARIFLLFDLSSTVQNIRFVYFHSSLPNIVRHVINYHCAKFGAFTTKPTIISPFCRTKAQQIPADQTTSTQWTRNLRLVSARSNFPIYTTKCMGRPTSRPFKTAVKTKAVGRCILSSDCHIVALLHNREILTFLSFRLTDLIQHMQRSNIRGVNF